MSAVPCRHFGTDGIRDVAGRGLLAEGAVRRWGGAIGRFLRECGALNVLIGRDTRASGPWISNALAGRFVGAGIQVRDAGVCPTPAISCLTRETKASLGIVVSASHNPAQYNGIKLFDGRGRKLAPEEEARIERFWEEADTPCAPDPRDRRAERLAWEDLYLDALRRHFAGLDLGGMRVALDCASGAAHAIAPKVFAAFGAEVRRIDPEPDGENINKGCGALHPERMLKAHADAPSDISFAFDGDADRVLLADGEGRLRDGDDVLAFCASARAKLQGKDPSIMVGTVLSNVGLELFLESQGVTLLRADVGDRNVTDLMERENAWMGGEPSGHIVIPAWGPTGDGIVTALHLLALATRSGLRFSEALAAFKRCPSIQKNVRVTRKPPLETLALVERAVGDARAQLAGRGRVLLRYSGTEPLARILVEGEDAKRCETIADRIALAIASEVGA